MKNRDHDDEESLAPDVFGTVEVLIKINASSLGGTQTLEKAPHHGPGLIKYYMYVKSSSLNRFGRVQ